MGTVSPLRLLQARNWTRQPTGHRDVDCSWILGPLNEGSRSEPYGSRMAKARLANGRPDTIGEPDAHLDDVPQQVRRSPSKLRFCTHCTAHPLR